MILDAFVKGEKEFSTSFEYLFENLAVIYQAVSEIMDCIKTFKHRIFGSTTN